MRYVMLVSVVVWSLILLHLSPVAAQNYRPDNYQTYDQLQRGYEPARAPHRAMQILNPFLRPQQRNQPEERSPWSQRQEILNDQMQRQMNTNTQPMPAANHPQQNGMFYQHWDSEQAQIAQVMAEARYVASLLSKKNSKPFIIIDKRNFQFYLYDRYGQLLRIGPVAIGKGPTRIGNFETPVGIFPIKSKVAVDDWIRPDWYFIEENEPIPKRMEDKRVPGFFRFKLVFDGSRYIHYAEATGGRLTHGCLGLDWPDAEAVFHTLSVGSYCIVIDPPFLARLARGEFPIKQKTIERTVAQTESKNKDTGVKIFRNMW